MNKYSKYRENQYGFSLLELLISITLGILVTSAAIQVLITSQGSIRSQASSSDLQDDGIFGLASLYKSLRMVNYGARSSKGQSQYFMNDSTLQGGIVLTRHSAIDDKTNVNLMGVITTGTVVSSDTTTNSSNVTTDSGVALPSSRLVVQRKVDESIYDCRGNLVPAGNYLVESYFVRPDTNGLSGEPNPLSFACTAANYNFDGSKLAKTSASGNNEISLSTSLVGNGEVLIDRVDYFGFLLGVKDKNIIASSSVNTIKYMTVADYNAITSAVKPQIVTLKIGLITRSATPSNTGESNSEQRFSLLDKNNLKLASSVASGVTYQRQALEKTIFIRNARG